MAWFSEHSLLCILLLAGAATFAWLLYRRDRLRMRPLWALPLAAGHVVLGVLCVKAFAILEAGSLEKAGNMSLFGAVFLLPPFYWLGAKLTKRRAKDVFDVFTVPTVFTLACARVNCILSGCCLGKPIPGTDLRWPTREAELVFYAALLLWLHWRTRRGDERGIFWPAYMAAYGIFRFLTEFFREPVSPLLHISHLWAVISFLTGLSICLQILARSKTRKTKPTSHRRKS